MSAAKVGLVFEGREWNSSVPRAVIRDARLSWAARGLFIFLWDLPQGWQLTARHLEEMSPMGRDANIRLRQELERLGALKLDVVKDGQKLLGTRWIVRAPSLWAKESPLKI